MLSWRYATLHYSTQGVLSAASRGYGGGPLYQSGLCFTIEAMLGEGDKVRLTTEAPAPPCNKQTASRDLKADCHLTVETRIRPGEPQSI